MMKKFVTLIVVSLIVFCMVSCTVATVENDSTEETSKDIIKTEEMEETDTDTSEKTEKYEQALAFIENKDYESAYAILKDLGDYCDAEEMLSRFHYAYDKGEIITDGVVTNRSVLIHNSENLPVQQISTLADGTVTTVDYSYDENGNVIKNVTTNSDGGKTVVDTSYDEDGNIIKKILTNPDGTKEIKDYTYNENGNLTKRVYTHADGTIQTEEYVYDENENIIKKIYTSSDGKVTTYEYTCKLVYIPYDIEEFRGKAQKEVKVE